MVFALYNGLVFLPVLLSLIGPGPQIETTAAAAAAAAAEDEDGEANEEKSLAEGGGREKSAKQIQPAAAAKENGHAVEMEPLNKNGISLSPPSKCENGEEDQEEETNNVVET